GPRRARSGAGPAPTTSGSRPTRRASGRSFAPPWRRSRPPARTATRRTRQRARKLPRWVAIDLGPRWSYYSCRGVVSTVETATDYGLKEYLPVPKGDRRGLALALSGGGYRAALFDLGALRRLNELGVLTRLTTIVSVSGGSVASAQLARHRLEHPEEWRGQRPLS